VARRRALAGPASPVSGHDVPVRGLVGSDAWRKLCRTAEGEFMRQRQTDDSDGDARRVRDEEQFQSLIAALAEVWPERDRDMAATVELDAADIASVILASQLAGNAVPTAGQRAAARLAAARVMRMMAARCGLFAPDPERCR